MEVHDTYISAIGIHLGEFVSAEQAIADGRYDAEHLAANETAGLRVAGDTAPVDMAVRAVNQAFERSGADPSDVDLLLYATTWFQGPDGWCPQYYVQRETIGGTCPALEIRNGCMGMFSGFQMAAGYLRASSTHRAVLIAGAENFASPLLDRWRTASPGMIIGDAACAVLLTKSPGFARLVAVDSVSIPQLEGLHRGAEPLFPGGSTIGRTVDVKARATEFIQTSPYAQEMRELVTKGQAELIDRVLSQAGISVSDISRVAYLNTSRSVIEQRLLAQLQLPLERTAWELGRDVGHAGVSDHIVALERLMAHGKLAPGDRFMMIGIGPGFYLAAAVIQVLDVPSWVGR
jgi:3-oxoacyl-[acyl-carrier-protein] synthase-3